MSQIQSEARERVLEAAEQLFSERGYAAVTLRDIALMVGIRHASLYHHFPGGKQQLFIEVTERNLQNHTQGLQQVLENADLHIQAQLKAVAVWLLSQPPMDLMRMVRSDMIAIDPEEAQRLMFMAYQGLIVPLHQTLEAAQRRGEIHHSDLGVVAGTFIIMIEGLYAIPDFTLHKSREAMAIDLIEVILKGIGTL